MEYYLIAIWLYTQVTSYFLGSWVEFARNEGEVGLLTVVALLFASLLWPITIIWFFLTWRR